MQRLIVALSFALVSTLAPQADARPSPPPPPPLAPAPAVAAVPPTPPVPPRMIAAFAPPDPSTGPSFFSPGQGRLGAHVSDMTPELRGFFGAPPETGILVQKVVGGSAAEDAGLAVGDVIVEVDGDDVADLGDVMKALAHRGKGDRVELIVIRDRKPRTLVATMPDGSSSSTSRAWSISGGGPFHFSWRSGEDLLERLGEIERRLEALEGKRSRPKKPPKKKR